ncbi:hypothetical protein OSB04_001829 [Centaurea solstitialis]|uniref:Uncharacterized protein n=1 Tax=Centaurea solstitialis TaxID=347529 RepID=A0AA38TZA4_9ASTR|nr:hypothetical protein OSB04_001829 [Centaurea solstitialis]
MNKLERSGVGSDMIVGKLEKSKVPLKNESGNSNTRVGLFMFPESGYLKIKGSTQERVGKLEYPNRVIHVSRALQRLLHLEILDLRYNSYNAEDVEVIR